jgi:hypothetical protein
MFEEYLQDANAFLNLARTCVEEGDERSARRYFRASIFYASSAMEAFVNYLGDTFAKGKSLNQFETAFINDKCLQFSPKKGAVLERVDYHSIDEKLRFLIKKFINDYDFNNQFWANFMQLKKLRDDLVHPKENDDNHTILEYDKAIHHGLSGVINIMDTPMYGIFHRHLRRKLLDLIPD